MLYSRFKRSKDLSNYSSEDLGCILGEKSLRPDGLRVDDTASAPLSTHEVNDDDGVGC